MHDDRKVGPNLIGKKESEEILGILPGIFSLYIEWRL